MAMEADRMVNLQLDDKVVLPERDVILNERGQTVESDPAAACRRRSTRARLPEPSLWPAHHRLAAMRWKPTRPRTRSISIAAGTRPTTRS